jgi:hypothetical protein
MGYNWGEKVSVVLQHVPDNKKFEAIFEAVTLMGRRITYRSRVATEL